MIDAKWFIAAALMLGTARAGAAITCALVTAPGVSFGAYDDSSAMPTDTTTTITVRCTRHGNPAHFNVTLSVGPSANTGLTATRRMSAGGELMDYNLFRDAGRASVWGQTSGVDTVTISITGIPDRSSRDGTFTVFGRIPAQQSVGVGAYRDSVTLTVSP